jgi:protein-S-isoprenylcysteine O-methyltransferase Ste14
LINLGRLLIFVSFIWVVSEVILGRMKKSKSSSTRREGASLAILWITISVSIALGVYIAMHQTGRLVAWSSAIVSVGIVLIVLGLVLRWAAIVSLGRMFTVDVAITRGHQLVRAGLYKSTRHPSYSGSLLSFLGLGLAFSNYLSLIVIFLPICAAFLYRIQVEERTLMAAFGDEYRDYCATTKRLIPRIY